MSIRKAIEETRQIWDMRRLSSGRWELSHYRTPTNIRGHYFLIILERRKRHALEVAKLLDWPKEKIQQIDEKTAMGMPGSVRDLLQDVEDSEVPL